MKKNKYDFIMIVCLIGGLMLTGCGTQSALELDGIQAPKTVKGSALPTETPAANVSFSNDVLPILKSRCFNCHGGGRVENSLKLGSYEDVLAGSENGAVIVPGDATNSLLVEMVINQKMPKRGPKLTPPQIQLITEWVNSGAPNN